MTPEERLDRMEQNLERHIQFVGQALTALTLQVDRTAAEGEETEKRLQELIRHTDGIDGRVKRLEGGK